MKKPGATVILVALILTVVWFFGSHLLDEFISSAVIFGYLPSEGSEHPLFRLIITVVLFLPLILIGIICIIVAGARGKKLKAAFTSPVFVLSSIISTLAVTVSFSYMTGNRAFIAYFPMVIAILSFLLFAALLRKTEGMASLFLFSFFVSFIPGVVLGFLMGFVMSFLADNLFLALFVTLLLCSGNTGYTIHYARYIGSGWWMIW